jgi:hypothetical protein
MGANDMRADPKRCHAAVVGFCVLLTVAAPLFAQAPPTPAAAPPPVRAERIADKLYVLTGGGGARSFTGSSVSGEVMDAGAAV